MSTSTPPGTLPQQGNNTTSAVSTLPEVCPLGFVCLQGIRESCFDIQERALRFQYGDVYDGIYCPEGVSGILNCPIGSYCPDPMTKSPCPSGYFCPHKASLYTSRPSISCPACDQGSKDLERNLGGSIALICVAALALLLVCWRILRRRAKFVAARLEALKERRLQRQKLKSESKSERKRVQLLAKRFMEIQKRLETLSDGTVSDTSSNAGSSGSMKSGGSTSRQGSSTTPRSASPSLSSREKGKSGMRRVSSREFLQEVMFRSARGGDSSTELPSKRNVLLSDSTAASLNNTDELQHTVDLGQLFDLMEEKCRGRLDYQGLNKTLQLTPLQLEHFVTRMNELGKQPVSNTLIKREVFCKNFFRVLEESLYFEGSEENASKLFEEMEQYGTNSNGEVNERTLYKVLSTHLSDPQISSVISKFRRQRGRSRNEKRNSVLNRETSGKGSDRRESQWAAPLTNLVRGISGNGTRSLGLPIVNESRSGDNQPPGLERNRTTGILPKLRYSISGGKKPVHDEDPDAFHGSISSLPSGSPPGLLRNESGGRNVAPTHLARNESSGRTLTVIHFMRHHDGRRLSVGSAAFTIGKEEFVTYYPVFLKELEPDPDAEKAGMDVAFEDLSLNVKVGGTSVPVVDCVTGRIAAGQMTALMGGSGAGKTSLLNALCGRAFYGEVTGTIRINGQLSTIEENRSVVGFVPQDDIVHAELTVRENFIFSGMFLLPLGTPLDDIEELADLAVASLGLKRVENSKVGDVNNRGISFGEKKRVNIGVELMGRPKLLCLDEPTSGLDASSAALIMKSLKSLAEVQGVTVCCVIHQPRKFIYDLFDSLFLLGAGGKTVYHGSASGARQYFERLKYTLPNEENVADWLIDISSGRLRPEEQSDQTSDENAVQTQGPSIAKFESAMETAKLTRENLFQSWTDYFSNLTDAERKIYQAPQPSPLPDPVKRPGFLDQFLFQLQRNVLIFNRNLFTKLVDTAVILVGTVLIAILEGTVEVTDDNIPNVKFEALVSPEPIDHARSMPALFYFAFWPAESLQQYGTRIGVITAILISLIATKAISEKRLQFFRESCSGYDVNAYYLAVSITTTIEHSLQIFVASSIVYWIRGSTGPWVAYFSSFFFLTWLTVSWALLFPLFLPPQNAAVVTGLFIAFFGMSPISYNKLYGNESLELLFGFVSVTRYFIEALTVTEQRCLPGQSGFTLRDNAFNFPMQVNSFNILSLAQNDLDNVTEQSCDGWYAYVLPCLMAGLTIRFVTAGVIHIAGRSQQCKKPLLQEARSRKGAAFCWYVFGLVAYWIILGGLAGVTGWFILRDT